ncbi:putative nucleic-acid-binding protein [Flavobacterium sp. 7A]|nr:putative nucleic-acid-binding protein [Flavobacterium sp. 7A]
MKTIYKTFAILAICTLTGITKVNAQNKNSKKIVSKKVSIQRVPASKVTYKTPKSKVATVRTLSNKSTIKYNGQNYYYSNNKYYSYSQGHYVNIMPKVGFRIAVLPQNYNRIQFKNNIYFQSQGMFYSQN